MNDQSGTVGKPSPTRDGKALDRRGWHDRRIGLAKTLRRRAEVKGAHRTAGPDHESGPSDPMYPKPLDARLSGALRLQRAKCITQPFPQHIDCSVQDGDFRTETDPDWINIRGGARRALTGTK